MPVFRDNGYASEDCETQFRDALAAAGFHIPGPIVGDGAFHRFAVGNRRDGSGYYRYFPDGVPNGMAGDHRTGVKVKWVATRRAELSWQERNKIQAERRACEEKRKRQQDAAAKRAEKTLERAAPALQHHPYLTAKQVLPYGLKIGPWAGYPNALLVPMRNSDGRIVSLQAILPDKKRLGRNKDYLKDGQKRGAFFTIGGLKFMGDRPVVVIVEGWATGASVHDATGFCTTIAFDRGNLMDVACIVQRKVPDAIILLAGDNDRWTDGNPGKRDAEAAANAVGGICVLPEFRSLEGEPTDFNDLQVREGRAEVRRQIMAALASEKEALVENAAIGRSTRFLQSVDDV